MNIQKTLVIFLVTSTGVRFTLSEHENFDGSDYRVSVELELDSESNSNFVENELKTCEIMNSTGLFLNNDPNLRLNLDGQITVLFRLVPNFMYQNQIFMIRQLRDRFDEYGFNALQFLIILPNFEDKRKEYLKITDNLHNVDVIYENSTGGQVLDMGSNQAFLIDQCRRLTFVIVPPWSHIQFPYIKAAILSSIYDSPCGSCETPFLLQPYPGFNYQNSDFLEENISGTSPESETELTPTEYTEKADTTTTFYDQIEDIARQDERVFLTSVEDNLHLNTNNSSVDIEGSGYDELSLDFAIPLRVILPVEHVHPDPHKESFEKFNYIVLRSDDELYHGHLGEAEEMNLVKDLNSLSKNPNLLNEVESNEFVGNKEERVYKLLKKHRLENGIEFQDVLEMETDVTRDKPIITPINTSLNLRKHYDQLVHWLTWQFE